MVDIHSHLSRNEVIGYLAGSQLVETTSTGTTRSKLLPHPTDCAFKASLIINRAYPCNSISKAETRNHNAEMCPEHAVLVHSLV